jgi:hypothetical protein
VAASPASKSKPGYSSAPAASSTASYLPLRTSPPVTLTRRYVERVAGPELATARVLLPALATVPCWHAVTGHLHCALADASAAPRK